MPNLIFWADVETTGTDTLGINGPRDEFLQIAGLVTDTDLCEIGEPFEYVVQHMNSSELRARAIPFVQEMHDSTGLWDRLATGTPLAEIDRNIFDYLNKVNDAPEESNNFRLAGNSVRLDLNNTEAYLPHTYSMLHYRYLDISSLDFAIRDCWGFETEKYAKRKTHNAVDDIRESIDQFRWLRTKVQKA